MYYIIGADQKEYGPITKEQLEQWIAEGRVDAQSGIRTEGSQEWRSAADFPEFAANFPVATYAPGGEGVASSSAGTPVSFPARTGGLPIASLVLGIVSMLCIGPFTGIPAIITGHMALGRIRRSGGAQKGQGLATAGLILGYVSLLWIPIHAAMVLPALVRAKARAQQINCMNNLHHIGSAYTTWARDHRGRFPFNVSTNSGGTMELASPDPDRIDPEGYLHLMVMSNELSTPKALVCPADVKITVAGSFAALTRDNVSYKIMSGSDIKESNPTAPLAACTIHGYYLTVDGIVRRWNFTPSPASSTTSSTPLSVSTAPSRPSPSTRTMNVRALHNQGLYYMTNRTLPPAERAKAVPLLESAAERGYSRSQYSLGVCYKNGIGVPTNNVLAWKWLQLAASHGSTNATVVLKKLERVMSPAEMAEGQKLAEEFAPMGTAPRSPLRPAETQNPGQ